MGLQIRINLIWTLTEKRLIESLILMKLLLSYNTGKKPILSTNDKKLSQQLFNIYLPINSNSMGLSLQNKVKVGFLYEQCEKHQRLRILS